MIEKILTEVYRLQNETVEHKWPEFYGGIDNSIEDVGDIYRELCKVIPFSPYIEEKMRRLRKFGHADFETLKSIYDMRVERSDIIKETDAYLVVVNKLVQDTEILDISNNKEFHIYDRKNGMTKALEIIVELCLYAKGEVSRDDVWDKIKELDKILSEKKKRVNKNDIGSSN